MCGVACRRTVIDHVAAIWNRNGAAFAGAKTRANVAAGDFSEADS
jgi:hypothetical protein